MTNETQKQETCLVETFNKNKHHVTVKHALVYVVLSLYAAVVLIPFWIMFVTSIKTTPEICTPGFTWWPTQGIDFSSYVNAFNFEIASITGNILTGFINTMWMVVPVQLVNVVSSALGAYAYAKINFKLRDAMFAGTLFMMLIPGTTLLIPTFFLYANFGWIGTPLPMIIPGLFGSAGTIFFITQYMRGVPNEMIEAAEVDGLGKFAIFWKIMLPVSIPALAAQFTLHFIGAYNDYVGPQMYLGNKVELYTLAVVLRNTQSSASSAIQSMMANSMIAVAPILVLYFAMQDIIINGVSTSALSK